MAVKLQEGCRQTQIIIGSWEAKASIETWKDQTIRLRVQIKTKKYFNLNN